MKYWTVEQLNSVQILEAFLKKIPVKEHLEGSGYFFDKRVADLQYTENSVLSRVKGSQPTPYHVLAVIENQNVTAQCSCKMKSNCKHIAATIMAAIAVLRKEQSGKKSNSHKVVKKNLDKTPAFSSSFSSNSFTIQDSRIKSWIDSMAAEPTQVAKKPAIQERHHLLFFIKIDKYTDQLSLTMTAASKNENYSKINQKKFDFRQLWDPSFNAIRESLDEKEWDILNILSRKARSIDNEGILLNFSGSGNFIKTLVETGRCFLKEDGSWPLIWEKPMAADFQWDIVGQDSQKLTLRLEDNRAVALRRLDPPCYYHATLRAMGPIKFKEEPALVKHLLAAPLIRNHDIQEVHKILAAKVPAISKILPKIIKESLIQTSPVPYLTLKTETFFPFQRNSWAKSTPFEAIGARVLFKYGAHFVSPCIESRRERRKLEIVSKGEQEVIKIERRLDEENDWLDDFVTFGWSSSFYESENPCDYMFESEDSLMGQAMEILEDQVPQLEEEGWTVKIDDSFPITGVFQGDEWYLDGGDDSVNLQNDWFDVKLGVLINGERVNMLPSLIQFIELMSKEKRWSEFDALDEKECLPLPTLDGKIIMVPVARIRSIAQHLMIEFLDSGSRNHESLRLSKWHAAFLEEFTLGQAAAKSRWMGSETLKDFAASIREESCAQEIPQPSELKCQLRPYQKEGLNWIQFLRRCNLSGILADDMGLGKTIQTLAHLLVEKESGRMTLPALIVAPTSLMPNWFNESAKFAPILKVLVLHGNERKLHFSKIKEFDLILTTYPLLMRDRDFLVNQNFYMMILDEAQSVKNHKTQSYQVLQQIKVKQRLCLSGTPMENHLGELWSLFNLLLPGFLGDQKVFQTVYRKPIEQFGNKERAAALAKRIKPFVLRRTKQQIALDLPEKTEIIQKIEFKDKQRDLYEAIRLQAQAQLMAQIQEKGLNRSQIAVLDALLKLRQVCCHPKLVKFNHFDSSQESAKLEWLLETLGTMIEENRKVLIFSQFTSMLAIIAEALVEKNIVYTMLTGETKDREIPVKEFQEGPVPVMLISLKAGGVGINLTAADTVIHYDPWWNPAAENQASDRAHRIGQTKAVFVYKLIVSGSLEEKILDLQERKKNLISSLLDESGRGGSQITMEDLENIFQPLPPPV